MNDEQVVSANVKPTPRIENQPTLGPHVAASGGLPFPDPWALGSGLGSLPPQDLVWSHVVDAGYPLGGFCRITLEARSVTMDTQDINKKQK